VVAVLFGTKAVEENEREKRKTSGGVLGEEVLGFALARFGWG
jgi:hypothetical protein